MVNCIQCKEEISEEARICPQCGQPQFYISTFTSMIILLVVSFILISVILYFLGFELEKLDAYASLGA